VAARAAPEYITFSGSGEPTLNSDIGWLIRQFKEKTGKKVAVLTNSTLLWMPEVKQELMSADLIVPSLDAATEEVWRKLNRPHPDLEFDKVIEGLVTFTNEYKGELWVEILFVKDINDLPEHVDALLEILSRMRHTKVQLNTVVRPPSEKSALALSYQELEAIAQKLPADTEAILPFRRRGKQFVAHGHKELILSAIARRPMTIKQIEQSLGIPQDRSKAALETLIAEGRAKLSIHGGETFYEAVQ
jgi:wyosine [tRNA(Phe)-imidazoG37] synthetase (radical SAM superfamily)